MKISKQSRRDAKSLFAACRVNGVLDDSRVRTAVTEVIARKPRGYAGTLHHLHRLVRLDLARRTAVVENAIETSPEQKTAIQAELNRRYGSGLSLTFRVNPALIGGIRVQVGSDIWDGSVAGRLTELASSL